MGIQSFFLTRKAEKVVSHLRSHVMKRVLQQCLHIDNDNVFSSLILLEFDSQNTQTLYVKISKI